MTAPTRWGIASACGISEDFVTALTNFDHKQEHKVVAVAARLGSRASEFAKSLNIPKFYEGYEGLAKDPEIDVVYIAAINPQHLPIAKLMIEGGKNVLVEKPMALNVKQTKELIEFAKKKKVFLMEAMWSWFLPTHRRLKEELDKGTVGDVRQVIANLGYNKRDNQRINKRELGGGVTLDIGIYPLFFNRLVMGNAKIQAKQISGLMSPGGIEEDTAVILTYDNSISTLNASMSSNFNREAVVYGTKGSLKLLNHFQGATKLVINDDEVIEFKSPPGNYKIGNFTAGLCYQAQHVRECLLKGLTESPVVTFEDTMAIAELMQEIRWNVGSSFKEDE